MNNGEIKTEDISLKDDREKIIRNHVLGSMGVGLIPFPVLDIAALAGVQLNMLRRLAERYRVPFSKDMGKHLIASLLGGGLPVSVGGTLTSFIKFIPLIGQAGGALTMPAVAGASTYAVGKVFIQHFESGGTFLDFNPESVRAYYAEMYKEGEKVTSGLKVSDIFDEAEDTVTEFVKNAEEEIRDSISEAVAPNIEPLTPDPAQPSESENICAGDTEFVKNAEEERSETVASDPEPRNPYLDSTEESEIRSAEGNENMYGELSAGCSESADMFSDESKKKKKAKRKKTKSFSV